MRSRTPATNSSSLDPSGCAKKEVQSLCKSAPLLNTTHDHIETSAGMTDMTITEKLLDTDRARDHTCYQESGALTVSEPFWFSGRVPTRKLRLQNTSNTWTISESDYAESSKDEGRVLFIDEYNKLAKKYRVRTSIPDISELDIDTRVPLVPREGSWIMRKLLSKTSDLISKRRQDNLPSLTRKMSVSDLTFRRKSRKEVLKNKCLEELVRLCGASTLYLPSEYAANTLIVPTCFRATAQYLVQHGMDVNPLTGHQETKLDAASLSRGIFRVPGSQATVMALYNHYASIDDLGDVISGTVRCPTLPEHIKCDIHDVASAFKKFLGGLPRGILGSSWLLDAFITIYEQLNADPEWTRTKQSRLKARLIALAIASIGPRYQRDLICAVFGLLAMIGRAAETAPREDANGRPLPTSDLMGYGSLGIVFGPLLLGEALDDYQPPEQKLTQMHSVDFMEAERRRIQTGKASHTKMGERNIPGLMEGKVRLANKVAEMLVTHWRDIVKHMKNLGAMNLKRVSIGNTDNVSRRFLRPSVSESFVTRRPSAWKDGFQMNSFDDESATPTPTSRCLRAFELSARAALENPCLCTITDIGREPLWQRHGPAMLKSSAVSMNLPIHGPRVEAGGGVVEVRQGCTMDSRPQDVVDLQARQPRKDIALIDPATEIPGLKLPWDSQNVERTGCDRVALEMGQHGKTGVNFDDATLQSKETKPEIQTTTISDLRTLSAKQSQGQNEAPFSRSQNSTPVERGTNSIGQLEAIQDLDIPGKSPHFSRMDVMSTTQAFFSPEDDGLNNPRNGISSLKKQCPDPELSIGSEESPSRPILREKKFKFGHTRAMMSTESRASHSGHCTLQERLSSSVELTLRRVSADSSSFLPTISAPKYHLSRVSYEEDVLCLGSLADFMDTREWAGPPAKSPESIVALNTEQFGARPLPSSTREKRKHGQHATESGCISSDAVALKIEAVSTSLDASHRHNVPHSLGSPLCRFAVRELVAKFNRNNSNQSQSSSPLRRSKSIQSTPSRREDNLNSQHASASGITPTDNSINFVQSSRLLQSRRTSPTAAKPLQSLSRNPSLFSLRSFHKPTPKLAMDGTLDPYSFLSDKPKGTTRKSSTRSMLASDCQLRASLLTATPECIVKTEASVHSLIRTSHVQHGIKSFLPRSDEPQVDRYICSNRPTSEETNSRRAYAVSPNNDSDNEGLARTSIEMPRTIYWRNDVRRGASILWSQIQRLQRQLQLSREQIDHLRRQVESRGALKELGTLTEELWQAKRSITYWKKRAEAAEKNITLIADLESKASCSQKSNPLNRLGKV